MAQLPESRPDYACAIVRDAGGNFLLQLRPGNATHAAGQLTCFGGRREPRETAEECLTRELNEELGWRLTSIPPAAVYLRDAQHLIATFHQLFLPAGITVHTEPGFVAVRAPPASLPGLPISPWHLLVLQAISCGGPLPLTVSLAALPG